MAGDFDLPQFVKLTKSRTPYAGGVIMTLPLYVGYLFRLTEMDVLLYFVKSKRKYYNFTPYKMKLYPKRGSLVRNFNLLYFFLFGLVAPLNKKVFNISI